MHGQTHILVLKQQVRQPACGLSHCATVYHCGSLPNITFTHVIVPTLCPRLLGKHEPGVQVCVFAEEADRDYCYHFFAIHLCWIRNCNHLFLCIHSCFERTRAAIVYEHVYTRCCFSCWHLLLVCVTYLWHMIRRE